MNHEELCNTFSGKACNCGVVDDALTLASQQIEEALAVMDAGVDPCFQELFNALEEIRDLARTGLPISTMTQDEYDRHRLNKIAGMADRMMSKAKGEQHG